MGSTVPSLAGTSGQRASAQPGLALIAVSAASSSNAWALGSTGGVSSDFHWNGHAWSSEVTVPGAFMAGVTATTKITLAAGIEGIWRWSGTAWRSLRAPTGPYRYAATASVTAKDVWAVGDTSPVVEENIGQIARWNGSTWAHAKRPSGNGGLEGIAAASSASVWAVGDFRSRGSSPKNPFVFRPDILRWNGKTLKRVTSPAVTNGNLNAVATAGVRHA
jgi:hypothetical protein